MKYLFLITLFLFLFSSVYADWETIFDGSEFGSSTNYNYPAGFQYRYKIISADCNGDIIFAPPMPDGLGWYAYYWQLANAGQVWPTKQPPPVLNTWINFSPGSYWHYWDAGEVIIQRLVGNSPIRITVPVNDGSSAPIPSGTYIDIQPGATWSVQAEATGGTPPYHWTASTTGSCSDSGALTVVCPSNLTAGNSFAAHLAVIDSSVNHTAIDIYFRVSGGGGGGELTVTAPDSMEVETGGSADYQAAATGGTSPYTWSSDNSLPWVMLSSDGAISILSAPDVTEDTEFTFTLTVTDSNGESDTVEIPITVTVAGGGGDDGEITLPELKFWDELKKKIMPQFGSITDDDILIDFIVSTPVKDFPFYFSMAESSNPAVMVLRDDIRPKLRLFFGLVLVIIFIIALCRILKK